MKIFLYKEGDHTKSIMTDKMYVFLDDLELCKFYSYWFPKTRFKELKVAKI